MRLGEPWVKNFIKKVLEYKPKSLKITFASSAMLS